MNEFEFIEKLSLFAGSNINSIGDDAVLFDDKYLLAKDLIVSGVHFLKTAPIDLIIKKLFTCNISDIAAMGGEATHILFGISAPKETNLEEIVKSVEKYCSFYNVKLIGGDTTSSLNDLFLSLTVIGKKGKYLLTRSGARNNDIIYISRPVGLCKASLENELNKSCYNIEKYYHYNVNAEVEVGKFLGSSSFVTAATDISDGLNASLLSIAKMSNIQMIVDENLCNFEELEILDNKDRLNYMFASGEEFALVFTVKKEYRKRFENSYFKKLNRLPIRIGYTAKGSGDVLTKETFTPPQMIYDYFCHFKD